MPAAGKHGTTDREWEPTADPEERYSSGIPDFDRLLGGGFARGSSALFHLDASVGAEDRDLLFTPLFLNFLYHSRGIIAVLPALDSPHGFRARVTRYATRRRFDSRVRIVSYVGEDDEAPYVVHLPVGRNPDGTKADPEKNTQVMMAKMVAAEKAAQGERKRPFLEVNAFEVAEMLFGADTATRMFFHGIKRARMVGNLLVGIERPGLKCADAVRAMADTEFELRHDDVGLLVRGLRPSFPWHVVTADRSRGPPHVAFVPGPGASAPVPATPARTRRR